ncbi:MAG: trimethylamine methyltransferase [Armatimonadia bacterium]|nr:trimethylamine methyltransferase [Armatimonadia bacterium]
MREDKMTETWRGGQYRPLSQADAQRVLDGAYRVLSEAGAWVANKRGREALKAKGAEVSDSDGIVRFPKALVEDAIASAPSKVVLCGRDEKHDCVLENSNVHLGTGGTALYVLDRDTGERRPSEVRDLRDCARLIDALEYVHLHTINVFPNEIDDKNAIDINRFYWSLKHTKKHIMGGIYSVEGLKEAIALAEMVAGSPQALRERPFVSFISLIISPLKIDDTYGEIACVAAENGLPIVVPTEPICGTTSPITPAANLVMHTADTLAGLCMVQAVAPGAPTIIGSVGSITDLRTMDHLSGPVERGMLNAGVSQIAQMIELPYYSTAGPTDSKLVDAQAAYESAIGNLLVMMSGANYIHDAAGLMEFDLTVAYEKMVMDNEIIGMGGRVLEGIEVSDDTLALDLICEQGPGGNFVAEMHTVEHMRDCFYEPTLSDRRHRPEWEAAGGPTATDLAKAKVESLLAQDDPGLFDSALDAEIRERFPKIKNPSR